MRCCGKIAVLILFCAVNVRADCMIPVFGAPVRAAIATSDQTGDDSFPLSESELPGIPADEPDLPEALDWGDIEWEEQKPTVLCWDSGGWLVRLFVASEGIRPGELPLHFSIDTFDTLDRLRL